MCRQALDTRTRAFILAFAMSAIQFQYVLSCPDGEYWAEQSGVCSPCPVATYKSADDDSCQSCPAGMVTLDTGSTDVSQCNVDISNTTRCAPGHHWYGDGEECRACPLGTYNPGSHDYLCLSCPYGATTGSTGATDKQQCLDTCRAGTERLHLNQQCGPCPIGAYRRHDAMHDRCLQCPQSTTTIHEGATDVTACVRISMHGSSFNPISCPPGTQWQMGHSGCLACPIGTYSDEGFCSACPAATSTLYRGAKYVQACMAQQVIDAISSRIATRPELHCPIGTEHIHAPLGCRPCPLGTFREQISEPQCTACANDTTTAYSGAHSATNCGVEMLDAAAHTLHRQAARSCPPGTDWHEHSGLCRACFYGSYRADDLQPSCTVCADGFTTAIEGATSPDDCLIPLPPSGGHIKAFFGDARDCLPGTEWYSVSRGCLVCPLGFYRSTDTLFCQPCPDGYSTLHSGGTSIRECVVPLGTPASFALTSGGCGAGYAPDVHNTTCLACVNGTYKSSSGFGACEPCPDTRQGRPAATPSVGATSELQCITDITIEALYPNPVLQAGGSTVQIHIGSNASQVRVDSIHTLAGVHCEMTDARVMEGVIHCVTTPGREPRAGPVLVYLQSWNELRAFTSSQHLHVAANPIVRHLHRTKVFATGGVHVTFDVDHAQPVHTISIIFYHPQDQSVITKECSVIDENEIECYVPDLSNWFTHEQRSKRRTLDAADASMRVRVGLVFDHWRYYSNLSTVLPDIAELQVMHNPIIWSFRSVTADVTADSTVVLDFHSAHMSFVMMGSQLMSGTQVEDYTITVGTTPCYVTMLSDASIECGFMSRDYDLLPKDVHLAIRVVIGNIVYTPGFVKVETAEVSHKAVKHRTSANNVIIIAAVLSVVAVLSIAGALVYCFKIRTPNRKGPNQQRRYEKREATHANGWEKERARTGWHSLGSSPGGSVTSHSSQRLPPLPVNSIFGPDRRTDNNDVIMRPLALPQTHFHRQQ